MEKSSGQFKAEKLFQYTKNTVQEDSKRLHDETGEEISKIYRKILSKIDCFKKLENTVCASDIFIVQKIQGTSSYRDILRSVILFKV